MHEFFGPAERDALRLSLAVATRSVLWSLPLAVLVAWLLTRARFHGRMLFDAFVHLPLVLPPVAVGYVLLVLFGTRGPFGRWLYEHFGVELAFSTNGAALATAVMTFPLMVRAIRISLDNVDRVANIPGRTRTLSLALYTAIQSPAGDALAVRLAIISFALGFGGLLIAEWLARRVRRWLGR
jgi:molybdate transport system permease protein